MDRFRLIKFSSGGRATPIRDLNDGSLSALVRDTLKFSPPAPSTIFSSSSTRFGGGQAVAQTHDNASCEFELYVNDVTANDSLALFDQIAADLDEVNERRYLEWRPEGATSSIYYELRGPGQVENLYRWIEFQGTKTLHGKFTCAVAPLAEGDRMEVRDDFSVDSISDYTFDAGGGTITISGGQMVPSDLTIKRFYHSARGLNYGDIQVTARYTPGTVTGFEAGVEIKRIGLQDKLFMTLTGAGVVSIYKRDGGTHTSLNNGGSTPPVAGSPVWTRLRINGNVVTAEMFLSEPTPISAPTTTVTHTLAGADATKFGSGVVGGWGGYWDPGNTSDRLVEISAEPYVYRNQTLPSTITLNGSIPGTAPALVDATISHTGSPVPFAMIAWAQRTAAGTAPFGILEAESDVAGDRVGWAVTADGATRGGSKLYDSSVSSLETYNSTWLVNPSLLVPDAFGLGELHVEVWGRLWISSTLVTPKVIISARSSAGSGYTYDRYTAEYGTLGKILTKPSTSAWRFARLGTLMMTIDTDRPSQWKVVFRGEMGSGSSGTFGLDYLLLVPARSRALSPTGKPNDALYPRFMNTSSAVIKRVRSDLSASAGANDTQHFPDHGLGGSQLIFPPGQVETLVKLSSLVPDDPTVDALTETLNETATVSFSVIPRYYVGRGA